MSMSKKVKIAFLAVLMNAFFFLPLSDASPTLTVEAPLSAKAAPEVKAEKTVPAPDLPEFGDGVLSAPTIDKYAAKKPANGAKDSASGYKDSFMQKGF